MIQSVPRKAQFLLPGFGMKAYDKSTPSFLLTFSSVYLCPPWKAVRVPPFISWAFASFRSNEIPTLAAGCVKSHFLFAGIKCCCVVFRLDFACDVTLLIGRTILVPAQIITHTAHFIQISASHHTPQPPSTADLLAAGPVTFSKHSSSAGHTRIPQSSSLASNLQPVLLDSCPIQVCS